MGYTGQRRQLSFNHHEATSRSSVYRGVMNSGVHVTIYVKLGRRLHSPKLTLITITDKKITCQQTRTIY